LHLINRLRILAGSWRQSLGRALVDRIALILTGSRVKTGPFAGMNYVDRGHCGAIGPRLLGCYESRVHPICYKWLSELSSGNATFVDIGAAEGYYAIGFLHAAPYCRTIAYEAEPLARASLLELAHENHVSDRLDIRGLAYESQLLDLLKSDRSVRFMMVDVEGAERDILTTAVAERLLQVELIVEAHEDLAPGTIATLTERFRHSHEIQIINNVTALESVSDFQSSRVMRWVPTFVLLWLVEERRGTGMTPWLHLAPRSRLVSS
jgi:hypothetical protein